MSVKADPGQRVEGKITLDNKGHILHSSGSLENDESTASALFKLAQLSHIGTKLSQPARLSLHYSGHSYILSAGQGKLHVAKVQRDQVQLDLDRDEDEQVEA